MKLESKLIILCLMSRNVPEVKVKVVVDCKTLPKIRVNLANPAIDLPPGSLEIRWIRSILSILHCIFIQ